MEQLAEKKYYSPEEYLALEEKANYKSEYYRGEIFAMSGGTINHNRIIRNLTTEMAVALKTNKCEVFMNDMRIWVDAKDLFTYPDIIVVCNKVQFYPDRNDTIVNPLVIVEVLSESTKGYDRGEKFEFYRTIPSFKEYILIDQYKIHVEHFYIGNEGKWVLMEFNHLDDILALTKVDFQISLQDIYHRVELGEDK